MTMKKVKTFLDNFIDEYSGNGKVSDKTSNLLSEALSSKMARLISEQSGESDPRGYKLVFGENLHAENSYRVDTGLIELEILTPGSYSSIGEASIDFDVVDIVANFEYGGKPYQFYFGLHIFTEDVAVGASEASRDPDSLDLYDSIYPSEDMQLIVKGFGGVEYLDSDDDARQLTELSEKFGFPNMETMVETWFENRSEEHTSELQS